MEIDFAWFLSIWVCHLRLDERTFWRTMNPVRCTLLFNKYFNPKGDKTVESEKSNSLAEYIKGGF